MRRDENPHRHTNLKVEDFAIEDPRGIERMFRHRACNAFGRVER
jgi:hypothetical protein